MKYPILRGAVLVTVTLFVFIYVLSQQYHRPREYHDGTLVSAVNDSYVHIIPSVSERGHDKDAHLMYTYKVLDAELCNAYLELSDRTKIAQAATDECPKKGIVTVVTGGRTANQIWEYASVWAIARLTQLDPYVCSCVKQHIEPLFEHLSLPTLKDIAHCPVATEVYVMSTDEWRHSNESIILPRYVNDERALMWADELRKEFKFKKELSDKAEKMLSKFLENRPQLEYTFVGVHVRRTDYIGHLKYKYGKHQQPVGPEFYTKGMQFYKDQFANCLFVFVSDDPQWCTDQFGHLDDVVVVWNNTPGEDLALLAACNHSVFDYGTFGEWGAILAGGMTVYSDLPQNIKKGNYMKNWIML